MTPQIRRNSRQADLSSSLRRNIQALRDRREKEKASETKEEKLADAITAFTGSMQFVYLHLVIFGLWIILNLWPGVPHFDPSFVILAMVASVEAIFLSTFVLISQNRSVAAANRRDDLDLQINLLAEQELTRLIEIVAAIADTLQVRKPEGELEEITKDVKPEAVLEEIEHQQQ